MSVKFAYNLCLSGQEEKLDKAFLLLYVAFFCFTDNMCSPDCTLKLEEGMNYNLSLTPHSLDSS